MPACAHACARPWSESACAGARASARTGVHAGARARLQVFSEAMIAGG